MNEVLPFHTDPEQWTQDVAEQYSRTSRPNVLISDVDDTLLDSNLAWYEDYIRLAEDRSVDEGEIVALEVFNVKGPRVILTEHHSLIGASEYPAYKHDRMHNPDFHIGMQSLDNVANTLKPGNSTLLPDGYISTRPASLGIVTRQSLTEAGFAPAPLLLRPEHVPYEETITFKIIALSSLRRVLDRATISYVDDYKGVVDAVNNLGDKSIRGIHYGSYTWQEIVRAHLNS